VNKLITSSAATSLVLKPWTGKVAAVPCCAPPVRTVQGTGLPFGSYEGAPFFHTFDGLRSSTAGIGARVGALVIDGMRADQVQATVPAAANGIPPRRTPSRC
jgi:hypothetical protein